MRSSREVVYKLRELQSRDIERALLTQRQGCADARVLRISFPNIQQLVCI